MRGSELLDWLCSLPAAERDRALEKHLGLDEPTSRGDAESPGPDLIGYHPSSVAAIVRALVDVPVRASDVLVDLGAGLGKVVLLAHLLTGASCRGIELQSELVSRSRAAARRLGLTLGPELELSQGDARQAELQPGTVFYLYAPFTGAALSEVLARLERVANQRAIAICALGLDLPRNVRWLAPRPSDSFWLTVYDSVVSGVPARMPGARDSALYSCSTDTVIFEREAPRRSSPKTRAKT